MLTAPQSFVDELEDESYEKLIKERDKLIREIRYYEKHREQIMSSEEAQICPSPDVIYQWNLDALGFLCIAISRKFNEEYEEWFIANYHKWKEQNYGLNHNTIRIFCF